MINTVHFSVKQTYMKIIDHLGPAALTMENH